MQTNHLGKDSHDDGQLAKRSAPEMPQAMCKASGRLEPGWRFRTVF